MEMGRKVSFAEYMDWCVDCAYDVYLGYADEKGMLTPYEPLAELSHDDVLALREIAPMCLTKEYFEAAVEYLYRTSAEFRRRFQRVFLHVKSNNYDGQPEEYPLQCHIALRILDRVPS